MFDPVPKMARILKLTADAFGLSVAEIRSRRRNADAAYARHCSMWLCRHLTPSSLAEIGAAHGGRDHSAVIYAVRRIEGLRADDVGLRDRLARLAGIAAIDAGKAGAGVEIGDADAPGGRLRKIRDTLAATVEEADGELYLDADAAPGLVRALTDILDYVTVLERGIQAVEIVRQPLPAEVTDLARWRRQRSRQGCGDLPPGGGEAA